MPLTGSTTPEDKEAIFYTVGVLENDVKESSDQTNNTTTVFCTVAWSERKRFRQEMLGWSENGLDSIHRVLPERCPWEPTQYCVRCELVKNLTFIKYGEDGGGADEEEDWPEFTEGVYQAAFTVPQYLVREDEEVDVEHKRFVQWTVRGTSSNQQIPGGTLKFPDGTPLDQVPVKTGRLVNLTARWLAVPYANLQFINDLSNKINSAEITLDGTTYPAETVLLSTWEKEPKIDSRGARVLDLLYHFSIRADGRSWNSFWRKKAGVGLIYEIPVDDNGDPCFQSADLNALFAS